MMWSVYILGWILYCSRFSANGFTIDQTCVDNCDCCKSSCYVGVHDWKNVCRNEDCIDGHRGARCYQLCTHDCVSCTSDVNQCDECFDGFYPGKNNDCKSKCQTSCKTCTSKTMCTACKDGYFNKDGSTTCPYTLCPENCECSDNTCKTCKHGFFDTGNECNQTCLFNCVTCLSRDVCNKCKHGFYNGYEFDNNARLLSNCSLKCRESCLECQSYDNCSHCVNGKYGPKCQSSCSIGCKDETCNIESGNCTCSVYFKGDRCTDCVTGKYGTYCNDVCPEHCKDGRCNRTTGYCSNGCITNTLIGSLCNICTVGMHGTFCNKTCPTNCKAKSCNRTTGVCSEGCKDNFKGPNCDTCIEGYFGVACDKKCPLKCESSICEKETGNCFSCAGNFDGDSCENCTPGFHGSNCNDKCSTYCDNKTCDIDSGVCDYGCAYNYSGDMCCVPGLKCVKCASITECKVCKNGFFGSKCNNTCSNLCIDNVCKQDSGICDKGCDGSNDDRVCVLSQTPAPQTSIGPIAGGVSGALIFIIAGVVFGIFLLKRRHTGKPHEQQNKDAETEHAREGHVYQNFHDSQLLEEDVERHSNATRNGTTSSVDVNEVEIDERSHDDDNRSTSETYYNLGTDSHRVNVNDLFSYVTTRHGDTFAREFGYLAKDLDLTQHCTIAKKPENLPLNRYNGIYPYDHSRVTIAGQPEFFINACYIDGYKNRQKEYIASLGPTAKTTDKFSTFWLMVWNEKSDIIVILTNLREASGMKCEQYWPDSDKQKDYGQIEVICRSVEVFAEYTVRTFSISKGKAKRNVVQLHYTAWPDKGVPEEVTSLVEFRQRVKAVPSILGGPVIIHCSAGVGRTGTYIALDQLTEEGKCEGSVDVFNCVNRMRKQRVNMVQTAEQYKFLYKSLVHSLSFGCEAMTAEEIQGLTYKADGNFFTNMFETLRQEIDIESKEDMEDREENKKRHKDKNRRHSDVPANRSRVRLYLARADGHHDYINAVFINSFKTKNLFIAAQSPLPGTVEDFICMIYQQNSSCVVALEESHNQNDLGKYLPADNETYKCGDFTVTSSKCETKEQYILKKVSIQTSKKSEVKTVYHFQYTKWGISKTVPDKVEDFVHFIKDVEKIISRQTEDQPHIVVHCLSGYERTGLFCVVYKLLEKLEAERQVSVVNTVRKIRTHRKQSIISVEQLKFCYQCISAYLEIYNTYSNFAT